MSYVVTTKTPFKLEKNIEITCGLFVFKFIPFCFSCYNVSCLFGCLVVSLMWILALSPIVFLDIIILLEKAVIITVCD